MAKTLKILNALLPWFFFNAGQPKRFKINHLGSRSEIGPLESGSRNLLFRALDYQVVFKAHLGGP